MAECTKVRLVSDGRGSLGLVSKGILSSVRCTEPGITGSLEIVIRWESSAKFSLGYHTSAHALEPAKPGRILVEQPENTVKLNTLLNQRRLAMVACAQTRHVSSHKVV
jgi:hypothetical protein